MEYGTFRRATSAGRTKVAARGPSDNASPQSRSSSCGRGSETAGSSSKSAIRAARSARRAEDQVGVAGGELLRSCAVYSKTHDIVYIPAQTERKIPVTRKCYDRACCDSQNRQADVHAVAPHGCACLILQVPAFYSLCICLRGGSEVTRRQCHYSVLETGTSPASLVSRVARNDQAGFTCTHRQMKGHEAAMTQILITIC